MHLARLALRNFRGFEALELELDPRMTVLVGKNGTGKSSVLHAIARAASCMALELYQDGRLPGFSESDIRSGQKQAEVRTTWQHPSFEHVVKIKANGRGDATASWAFEDGRQPAAPPLCIHYGTFRSRARYDYAPPISLARAEVATEHPAWDDELNSTFLTFERLRDWFRQREDLENQQRVQKQSFDFKDPALEAVRRAVSVILGQGFGPPRIERARGVQLVIGKNGVELSAEQLSEGERSLLILAGSLARSLALADPNQSDPLGTPAIALIDEVELHLHPAWQRTIIGRLGDTFPNVQFVIATHSAVVLSETKPESVRVLENFQAFRVGQPVYGRDVNTLLRDILGGRERPTEIEALIHQIALLLDEDEVARAKRAMDDLERVVGAHDPEVIRLRTMLDFLERPLDTEANG